MLQRSGLLQTACLCLAMLCVPLASMAQTSTVATAKPASSGNWKQLKPHEQRTLAPLAVQWGELTETQRSKWLAIAQNFEQLPAADQQVMQARMKEWVALSPAQRNQARLNFNTLQNLSKDQRKSRWDEYQSLSEEEKRKLSAGVLAPARTAAPSPRPMASDRLVQPTVRTVPAAALPPRAPIDRKTLLPVAPAPAPADSQPAAAPAAESTPEASAS